MLYVACWRWVVMRRVLLRAVRLFMFVLHVVALQCVVTRYDVLCCVELSCAVFCFADQRFVLLCRVMMLCTVRCCSVLYCVALGCA